MNRKKIVISTLAAAVIGLGLFSASSIAEPFRHGEREFLPMQEIHDKLKLSGEQEKTWQVLEQKTRDMRMSGRDQRNEIKSQARQELDKAEPDLARVARLADQNMDEQTAKRRQLRDEWLKLYAQLSPEQKLVVRDALKARMAKMEMFREKFKQRRDARNPS